MQGLTNLDLSEITMTSQNCMQLSNILSRSASRACLRELSLQNCRIRGDTARIFLDGLEKNTNLFSLNISQNDFSSRNYELSAKLGKIMARHKSLTHLNIGSMSFKVKNSFI
jgi:hypothetical protein